MLMGVAVFVEGQFEVSQDAWYVYSCGAIDKHSSLLICLGLISLGAGLPSSAYFPIENVAVKVPAVPHFSEEKTRESGVLLQTGKHDVSEGKGAFGAWKSHI